MGYAAPLLADRYHLIAPITRDSVRATRHRPRNYAYTFDNLAATMAGWSLTSVSNDTRSHAGYGGPVGFRMAMARPERVSALIIQNANAYTEGLGANWQGIARYWADPTSHPEQVDVFTSLEGAKQRHLGTSPNPERYNQDTWRDEHAILGRPGEREIQAATPLRLSHERRILIRPGKPGCASIRGRPSSSGGATTSFIVQELRPICVICRYAELHLLDAGHFAWDEATDDVRAD